jgi:predicted DNA-binding transcriptional regulator YafY
MNIDMSKLVVIGYTNHRGEESVRTIVPLKLHFGTNDYYKTPQWIIEAWDCGKEAPRSFALANIHNSTDMAHKIHAQTASKPGRSTGERLAQELAQALIDGDETAGQVAAINIVGNVLDRLETIAEAMEKQARCIADVVDYSRSIHVTNG